ncbi:MAG: hypothetical protein B6241_06115 [Spirochaetaceae bacterium 4572_59]|nr:MAG: hypothetical protein B6241_06115 [Spirochaetaceae bacterium 4572_59]
MNETDALILTDSTLLGVIFTADCLPVILYDLKMQVGAVIHAGWRGSLEAQPGRIRKIATD